MIRLAALCLLFTSSAAAQSGPPVLLVHGIKASDLTWSETTEALEADGWGTPYTIHADLNASEGTKVEDDVVLSMPFPTSSRGTMIPLREGEVETLGTRLFLINFEAVYDADSKTLMPHAVRDVEGRSNSNESGIVKQGAALGRAIADVLESTAEREVILIGHSMGGLAIREYLQRTDAEGRPRWWVDPGAEGGHRVRAVVTYGTPHQGSNATNFSTSLGSALIPDGRSEAVRDLRYSYRLTSLGQGRYLYGGEETETDVFFEMDVTADGDEDDTVVGLNAGDNETPYAVDNPAMPLPTDIRYTYIVGRFGGFGSDGVVDAERQVLQRLDAGGETRLAPEGVAERVVTDKAHTQQTSDAETIRSVLRILTPAEPGPQPDALALRVGPNPIADYATLWLDLPDARAVQLVVLDVQGREVARLADGWLRAGGSRFEWPPGLAPGVYAVVASVDGARVVRRVSVVR